MRRSYRAVLILIILMFGCNSQKLNENLPDYIKEVVAYKEGPEGLMIYFILADASGAMTTSDGEGKIRIKEVYHYPKPLSDLEFIIYAAEFRITKDAFVRTTVGQGAFEHEVILFSLGRLPYSEFLLK